jgi:NTE family protein
MMTKRLSILVLLVFGATAYAADPAARRPRIGLVLSGGGARGAAHIGVLKVLEELHIPVDYIAGTSMGSAVGGLYATGLSAEELDVIFRKFDWEAAFTDNPPRRERAFRRKQDDQKFLSKFRVGVGLDGFQYPRGAVDGQNFVTELRKLGRITQDLKSFNQLPIPFRCMATDLVKGTPVVLDSGDLAMAIRASVSIAPMFTPVKIKGRLLVDGGYLNNIPVNIVKAMGADRVIVINIGTPLSKESDLRSIFDVMSQTGRVGGEQFDREQKDRVGPKDILVEPDLQGLSFVDFGKVPQMIDRGEAKARSMIDQLKEFSIPEDEYKAYRASRKAAPNFPIVDYIEVRQEGILSNAVIEPFIRQPMGQPVDPVELQKDLARIYGLGYYDFVDYHVQTSTAGNTLVVEAPHRSWGPNYLRFGLNLQDNFNGNGRYQVAARYTMTELNRMGAELQADGRIGQDPEAGLEFYQPVYYSKAKLDYAAAYFVAPTIGYGREVRYYVNSAGHNEAQYTDDSLRLGMDAGRQLSNWGELRAGLHHSMAQYKLQIGSIAGVTPGDLGVDETYGMARLSVDTADRVAFTHQGILGVIEFRNTVPNWTSDYDYRTIDANGQFAIPLAERHTLRLSGVLGTNLNQNAALPRVYALGGFNLLTAFSPNELLGQNRALGQLRYEWKGGVVGRFPWYLGALGETGGSGPRLTDTIHDKLRVSGSVYAGLDTVLGPLVLTCAVGSQHHQTTWLVLGSPF